MGIRFSKRIKTGFKTLITAAFLFYALAARAETTVFGLTIGKPLAMSECPKYSPYKGRVAYMVADTVCAKEFNPKLPAMNVGEAWVIEFPFSQQPAHAQNNLVQPVMINGLLEAVLIWTHGNSTQEAVFLDLVAKFGEPTKKNIVAKSNAYGASVHGIEAVWDQGDDLQVLFFGVKERVDRGELMIGSRRGFTEYINRMKRSTGSKTPL